MRYTLLILPVILATLTGCSKVNPVQVLEPIEVTTGWFDAGIMADGKNKLVPTLSLKLRNKAEEAITGVQIMSVFKRVGEQEMWGEHYGWAVRRDELAPGASTAAIVMRSQLGYTGEQPRIQILQHGDFIDAKVEVFLKKGSQVWAKLGDFPIERQLLTQ